MKGNIFIYMAAAALLVGACSKDLTESDNGPAVDGKSKLVLFGTRPSSKPGKGSRVAITGDNAVWSTGDQLAVFASASSEPVAFTLSSGAGTTTAAFEGTIDFDRINDVYVMYPYVSDMFDPSPEAAIFSFAGQSQDGFGANAEAHLGRYAYMASAPVKFSEDGEGTLSLSNLAVKMSFEFSLPEAATVKFLTMSTAANLLYDKGVVDLTAAAPAAKPWGTPSRTISMEIRNGEVAANQKVTAHMMVLPVDLSSQAVTFYVAATKADGTPVTYTMKKTKGLKFEASSSYVADVDALTAYKTYLPMVYVPGGSLNICALDIEGKTEEDIIAADYKVNSFWIAPTEVTNQQYCDFLNSRKPMDAQLSAWLASNWGMLDTSALQIEQVGSTWKPKSGPILQADGSQIVGSYADYPMINVTYLGAGAYCSWLAERMLGYPSLNSGYYIPTEVQWEYAATGSEWNPRWNDDAWAGSDDPSLVMWSCRNCDTQGSSCLGMYVGNGEDPDTVTGSGSKTGGTHPVGKLQANYLGLYDMSGNVSEICRDWFHLAAFPYGTAKVDPWCDNMNVADKFQGEVCRSCRGGLWSSFPTVGVTYARDFAIPAYFSNTLGFRPMLPLK